MSPYRLSQCVSVACTLLAAVTCPLPVHGQAASPAQNAPTAAGGKRVPVLDNHGKTVLVPSDVADDGICGEYPVITAPPSPLRQTWGPGAGLGHKVPHYRLQAPDGRPFRLTDLHGKVVVLDMWLTTCGPCLRGLPHLSALARTYQGRDVAFETVCCDAGQDWKGYHDRVAQFAELGLPLYADPSRDLGLRSAMSIGSPVPTDVIISRSGKVIGLLYGEDKDGHDMARLKRSLDVALTTAAGS